MGRDPRRRIPAATIKSLLRKLEAIHLLASGEIDDNRAKIIRSTAEGAYREILNSAKWLQVQAVKRSEEVMSAARAMGLALEHRGRPISYEVIEYRMKSIAKARETGSDWSIPGYWLK